MSLADFQYGDRVRFKPCEGREWPPMVVVGTASSPDRVFATWVTGAEQVGERNVKVSVATSAFHPDWIERIAS